MSKQKRRKRKDLDSEMEKKSINAACDPGLDPDPDLDPGPDLPSNRQQARYQPPAQLPTAPPSSFSAPQSRLRNPL